MLKRDRYFDPDPAQQVIGRELYNVVSNLPLLCPHGHVDPRTFAEISRAGRIWP